MSNNWSSIRCWSAAAALFVVLSGCMGARTLIVSNAESVQVFYYPEDAETVAALSPEDLRRTKSGFAEVDDPFVASEAWGAAKTDVRGATDRWADVRWGLRILDGHRKVLAEYYVDKTGTRGFDGARRVDFSGHLREWLRAHVGIFAS